MVWMLLARAGSLALPFAGRAAGFVGGLLKKPVSLATGLLGGIAGTLGFQSATKPAPESGRPPAARVKGPLGTGIDLSVGAIVTIGILVAGTIGGLIWWRKRK